MEFSDNFVRLMSNNIHSKGSHRINSNSVELSNQTLVSKIVEIPLTENTIEVPWFAREYVQNILNPIIDDYAIIPLAVVEHRYGALPAGSDALMKYFIRNTNFGELYRVTTTKGEIYYGTNGLIFDKDFNLIFAGTVNIEKEPEGFYHFSKINLYINPKVFLQQDNMVCKSLIKKILPYYLSNTSISSFFYGGYYNHTTRENISVNIVVGVPSFIKDVNKPNCADGLDDEINNLLLHSTSELASILENTISF